MIALAPVLKYPGAKWRLADWIVGHLPAHEVYLEPFFGSGAVFFSKQPARLETISDLDGDVVNFFRVLRERPEELAWEVAATPWAREEWEASYQPTNDPLERARRFIVRAHQSHGMRPRNRTGWRHATGISASMGGGIRNVARQWANLPPLLLATAERLKDAQIEQRPALDVIARFAHTGCLIYADPPYPRSTRSEWQYKHELTDADHLALLAALDAHPGPVVLSGYRCALYDNWLAGWQRLDMPTMAEGGRARVESLWLNAKAARPTLFDLTTL